jgi:transmembrane sensor
MERKPRTSLNGQISEEAGEWFLAFRDGELDAATRSEFDLWVRRSPDHLAAYLEIAAIWNEGPGLESADTEVLIARAAEESENVVPLSRGPGMDATRAGKVPFVPGGALKAASFLIVCVCAATVFWFASRPVYSTGFGEQRTLTLKDGSRVELNSRSKVRIRFSDEQRIVELIQGQALFSVAKDAERPFVVDSGAVSVRAVGTQFDVYRRSAGTVVTVVEGQVVVRGDSGNLRGAPLEARDVASGVLISAGQQLVATQSRIHEPTSANLANTTAWTQQQLAFDGATLSEVAEEFNRYNERQLIIRDRAAFNFRVSGVFSSSSPQGLIRFLEDRPDVRVIESHSEIVIEKAEDPHAPK